MVWVGLCRVEGFVGLLVLVGGTCWVGLLGCCLLLLMRPSLGISVVALLQSFLVSFFVPPLRNLLESSWTPLPLSVP